MAYDVPFRKSGGYPPPSPIIKHDDFMPKVAFPSSMVRRYSYTDRHGADHIVLARSLSVSDGVMLFRSGDELVLALAPGQWQRVEEITGEEG